MQRSCYGKVHLYKSKQENQHSTIEIRVVFPEGGAVWEGSQGGFWRADPQVQPGLGVVTWVRALRKHLLTCTLMTGVYLKTQ